MKALVTGANGLIGANLVRDLLKAGHEVRALIRETSDVRSLKGLRLERTYGDLMQPASLAGAAHGCEIVFHTASVFAYSGVVPSRLNDVAVEGTVHLLTAAKQAGVRRVVLTSSSVVFGSSDEPCVRDEDMELRDPAPAPYVTAKAAQLHAAFSWALAEGLELVAVCPTMSVGPHDYRLGPSNGIIVAYLNDPYRFTFPGGCNIVSALDVARGHVLAGEFGQPGCAYLLGSENLTWVEIHATISELCGLPGPFIEMNHTGSYVAAACDEIRSFFLRTKPMTTRSQARMVGRFYWYDHTRAASLGFSPNPSRLALAQAISWLIASQQHVSRETRATLTLTPEVYAARRTLKEIEDAVKESAS